MSYPPPRYHGNLGEKTAWLRPDDADHDLTYDSGVTIDFLATGAKTDQGFGLYRYTFGPKVGGPGPHFHRGYSESFYVLDGTVEFHDGDDWKPAGTGDFLHIPPGAIHGFRNVEGVPASMLLLFAPGAPREEYFAGLTSLGSMGEAEMLDFFLRHDNHWL